MDLDICTAIRRGFFQQVRFLIELGYDVNARDAENRTPLMLCALVEDEAWGVGLARTLLEKGARLTARDRLGLTAAMHASLLGRAELVRVLLEAIDFDLCQGDREGDTALHHAARRGQVEVTGVLVRTLRRYGLAVDARNHRGETALIAAWQAGQAQCAALLTEDGGADPDARDNIRRWTASQWQRDFLVRTPRRSPRHGVRPGENHVVGINRPRSATVKPPSPQGGTGGKLRRPPSAPLLRRRREGKSPARGIRDRREVGSSTGENLSKAIDKLARGQMYRSASHSDLRNRPDFVFNLTPLDCFQQDNRRPETVDATAGVPPGNGKGANPASDWRSSMGCLYTSYDYQFTDFYRPIAKAQDPSAAWVEEDCSTHPSDGESLADRFVSSLNIVRKFTVKRAGAKTPAGEQGKPKKAPSFPRGLSKRSTGSSGNPGSGLLKAQPFDAEDSSADIANTLLKMTKKRGQIPSDAKENLADITNQSETKGRPESKSRMKNNPVDENVHMRASVHSLPIVK